MSDTRGRTPGVDSARRVLRVLLLFSGDHPELTAEEIARAVEISVPSAYRFISLLREMNLVDETGSGTYTLSPRVFSLSQAAEHAVEGWPILHHLVDGLAATTGETALVIRRVGDFATCVVMSQPERAIRLSFLPGQMMGLHRGAGAKLLLADMGAQWARRYFDRLDPPVSNAERKAVLAELPLIAEQGWAKSAAEVDEGVWAVAAPVHAGSRLVAAVSVAGPQFRIDARRAETIQRHLLESAAATTRELTGGSRAQRS